MGAPDPNIDLNDEQDMPAVAQQLLVIEIDVRIRSAHRIPRPSAQHRSWFHCSEKEKSRQVETHRPSVLPID
jgi:hypothetical protein